MSGDEEGVAPQSDETASQVVGAMAATAGAGALAVVAGTCLVAGAGVYALGVVGHGAIRLGKNTYTAIDEQCNESVAREMIQHQEKLRRQFAASTPTIGASMGAPIAAPATPAPVIVSQANPLEELEKIIQDREAKEKRDDFPSTVSAEMKGELEKIQKMIQSLHQNARTGSVGSLREKGRDQPLRNEILALADLVMPLYPDLANSARSKALGSHTTASVLQKEKLNLQKKDAALQQYVDLFSELGRIKAHFDSNPVTASALSNKEKARFNKEFNSIRDQIEATGAGDIGGLEQLRATLASQAMMLHDQKMFEDGAALFQKAMENAGYTVRTSTSQDGAVLILDGVDAQRVKTRITLGTPAANPDGQLRMKMEVDMEEKLTTPGGDGARCDNAMKRLQREIDSVGLQVKIKDRTLRRAGKLVKGRAENTITETLAELGVNNVKVTIQGDNGVDVDGTKFDFSPSDSVHFIAEQIKAQLHGERVEPQRERLMEKE